jgi:hypothetical protein
VEGAPGLLRHVVDDNHEREPQPLVPFAPGCGRMLHVESPSVRAVREPVIEARR